MAKMTPKRGKGKVPKTPDTPPPESNGNGMSESNGPAVVVVEPSAEEARELRESKEATQARPEQPRPERPQPEAREPREPRRPAEDPAQGNRPEPRKNDGGQPANRAGEPKGGPEDKDRIANSLNIAKLQAMSMAELNQMAPI